MNTFKTILLTAAFLLTGLGAAAQSDDDLDELERLASMTAPQEDTLSSADTLFRNPKGLKLLARSYGDSIVLRWATDDAGLWLTATKYGWMLYRSGPDDKSEDYAVDIYGDTIPYVALNGGKPIKPLTLDEMMQRFDSTNLYAGVGAQALYGQFEHNINKQQSTSGTDFFTLAAKQYQEQQQRHVMAMLAAECDPQVAEAIGLRFVDRNVKPNQYYEYMLQCMVPPEMVEVEMPDIIVPSTRFRRKFDERIPDITITQLDAYRVAVRWDKNKLSGYWLDRREHRDSAWVTLNTTAPIWPMVPDSATVKVYGDSIAQWMENEIVYMDSLALGKDYTYRVRAFDAFGERVDPRETESFRLEDLIPPTPPYVGEIIPIKNHICKIDWIKLNEEPDFKGYLVMFSPDLESHWQNVSGLLPPGTQSYTDSNAYERGRGFYRIFVSDTAGNVSYSASMLNHIEDATPPASPRNLRAYTDDSTGAVYVHWSPNKEPDFIGYRLYAANQRDHDFIEVSPGYLSDTFFVDTVDLSSITRYIYYYLVAVDNNYNISKTSDTLAVLLPDLIAPGVCILEKVSQDRDTVHLTWRASVSNDVENYFIYRKLRPSVNWECVAILRNHDVDKEGLIHFTDNPKPAQYPYTYCIEARDLATNSSGMAGYAVVQIDESPLVDLDITLKAKYKKGKTTLSWKYKYDGKKDYYGVIYRSVEGGPFEDIGTFERGAKEFVDTKVPEKASCTYYIQLQLGRGRHSTPSNQVSVKTK